MLFTQNILDLAFSISLKFVIPVDGVKLLDKHTFSPGWVKYIFIAQG